ncbi:MAG: hypothetical protein M1826_005800 [Phylliscum demangeonii]|nr:MAG: hypothetical protein M1826_005800 [Phylliscum demangeonii]
MPLLFSGGPLLGYISRRKSPPAAAVLHIAIVECNRASARRIGRERRPDWCGALARSADPMENVFIGALVRASLCKEHATPPNHPRPRPSPERRPSLAATRQGPSRVPSREYHTTLCRPRPEFSCQAQAQAETHASASMEEYINLVDYYDAAPLDELASESLSSPSAPPLLPAVEPLGAEEKRSGTMPSPSTAQPWNEETQAALDRLTVALRAPHTEQEVVFELYQALPRPRLSHLPRHTIRLLLRRLSVVERKTVARMMRFLSVVEDVKAAEIPLTTGEWTSVMSFAARCLDRVSAVAVESALHVFRQMEREAGVRADHVTFNVLFDVAAKAGKFVLAELILREMQARGLVPDRWGRVGLIFYHGLKGDGDGVRAAYRQLVTAGHIVDTVVLNCVVASLLRAGEPSAAEHVYERMKAFHASRRQVPGPPPPPPDWRRSRDLAKVLQRAARLAQTWPDRHRRVQEDVDLAPNLRTFRILIHHHAVQSGDLDTLTRLLHEMQWYAVPLHGAIFLAVLKGFAIHGGDPYSAWTPQKLERVWAAYLHALEQTVDGIYLGSWMIIWALRAFAKCISPARMLRVWDDLRGRWEPSAQELLAVDRSIQALLRM